MLGKTHIVFGGVIGLTTGVILSTSSTPILGVVGMTAGSCFGALMPDVDADESIINKKMGIVGDIIAKHVKHRTTTHTIYALVIFSAILFLLKKIIINIPLLVSVLLASSIAWLCNATFGDILDNYIPNKKVVNVHIILAIILAAVFVLNMDYSELVLEQYLIGLSLGYASHLFADCCTVSGCPLFSKKDINFMSLRTGKHDKYFIIFSIIIAICLLILLI